MPDRSSAQSREPDRPEPAEQGKASTAPAATERPLWRKILTPLALRVVGTVPADEAETVSHAISRVEQAAEAAQKASAAVQKALADAERKPPLWRRVLTPLVLSVVGAVLLLLTFGVYPRSPAVLGNEGPAQLEIETSATVTGVDYSVTNGKVEVNVYSLAAQGNQPTSVLGGQVAIYLWAHAAGDNQSSLGPWIKTTSFSELNPHGALVARTSFSVDPVAAGMTYNGLTAELAFPEVTIEAPMATPELDAIYNIPSGSSYDWSPSPPSTATGALMWVIPLTSADTPGQMVVGTNHAREDSDNFRIFIAGVLVALAGAALLAAVQEALSRFAR